MRYSIIILSALLTISTCSAQQATYRYDGKVVLNDLKVTPGTVRTTDPKDICAKGFRTGVYRHTTEKEKKEVCKEYGVADCPDPKNGEIDHLVALDDGGADVISNLWFEPASPTPGYHQKDLVEVWVHKQVCSGKANLVDMQKQLETDWYVLYKRMIAEKDENSGK